MTSKQQDDMLTVEEVVVLFDQHNLTRDRRSIQRYAVAKKLAGAFLEPDERRWYVPRDSALRFIKRVKEINARHRTTSRVDIRTPEASTELPSLQEENKELKNKVRHLEIDIRVKEKLVNHMDERVAQLYRDSLVMAEAKGRLEAENSTLKERLTQIATPAKTEVTTQSSPGIAQVGVEERKNEGHNSDTGIDVAEDTESRAPLGSEAA